MKLNETTKPKRKKSLLGIIFIGIAGCCVIFIAGNLVVGSLQKAGILPTSTVAPTTIVATVSMSTDTPIPTPSLPISDAPKPTVAPKPTNTTTETKVTAKPTETPEPQKGISGLLSGMVQADVEARFLMTCGDLEEDGEYYVRHCERVEGENRIRLETYGKSIEVQQILADVTGPNEATVMDMSKHFLGYVATLPGLEGESAQAWVVEQIKAGTEAEMNFGGVLFKVSTGQNVRELVIGEIE